VLKNQWKTRYKNTIGLSPLRDIQLLFLENAQPEGMYVQTINTVQIAMLISTNSALENIVGTIIEDNARVNSRMYIIRTAHIMK